MARESEFSASEDGRMDIVDDDAITEDELEEEILLADDYRAADDFGTTPAEALAGESLDMQLAQEEPDVPPASVDDRWPDGPGPRTGQLVSGDDADTATELGEDSQAAGEDAAVHIRDESPPRQPD